MRWVKSFRKALVPLVIVAPIVLGNAQAAYIEVGTNRIISDGGEAFVRFEGRTAADSTNLVLERDNSVVFNNQTTAFGSVFSLGTFAIGEVISFRFDNLRSGLSFFTGNEAANFDSVAHARLIAGEQAGTVLLGLEDLAGGGDQDFDDLVMTVFEAVDGTVPLPGAAWLLISGFAGLAFASRRKGVVSAH